MHQKLFFSVSVNGLTQSQMPSNSSLLTLNRKLAHLTRANRYSDALQFFTQSQSQSQSPKPDHYTISTLITATSNLTHITFGNQLHAYAIRTGLKAFLMYQTLCFIFTPKHMT
ncbi:hypothetical protein CsatB_011225 [Cannabis sativa]